MLLHFPFLTAWSLSARSLDGSHGRGWVSAASPKWKSLWPLPFLTTVDTGALSERSLVVNTLMLYSTPGLRLSNRMEV